MCVPAIPGRFFILFALPIPFPLSILFIFLPFDYRSRTKPPSDRVLTPDRLRADDPFLSLLLSQSLPFPGLLDRNALHDPLLFATCQDISSVAPPIIRVVGICTPGLSSSDTISFKYASRRSIHQSSPATNQGENIVRELSRCAVHLLATCKHHGLFPSEDRWRMGTRAYVALVGIPGQCSATSLVEVPHKRTSL